MKRVILSAALMGMAAFSQAYEKIEFRNMVQSPAFQKPSAVAVASGTFFVADSKANAVFEFDAAGRQVGKISSGLDSPSALAFGSGKLYVADTGNSRVAVFDASGKPLWTFSGKGSEPGQLKSPEGIAYGPDDSVYVSDTGNSRVEVYNSDGIYLYSFPVLKSDGVTRLEPAKISLSRSGDVLVSDPGRGLLQRYDRTGKLLKEYDLPNDGAAFNKYGYVYAIDSREGKVIELSETGENRGTFGTRGRGKAEFLDLRDIAIGGDGTLYLCDAGNKKVVTITVVTAYKGPRLPEAAPLARFLVKGPEAEVAADASAFSVAPGGGIAAWLDKARELDLFDGAAKKTLAKEGRLQGQLRSPGGLFVGPKGDIYVADTGNDRVEIFKPDGSYENMFGESGSGEGEFRSPSAVAVNSLGNIYVADTGNRRVKAFSHDGMFLFAMSQQLGGAVLDRPVSVVCDEDGNVYILDEGLKKVIVTDAMGKFIGLWDGSGSLQDPVSLAYDGKGFFYVLDKGTSSVKIFDRGGKLVASFFARGRGGRELWDPAQLAFSGDRLYISDPGAQRVAVFDVGYLPRQPSALSAKVGEESVGLSWKGESNAWTDGFKVFRAAGEGGKIAEIGPSREPSFEDRSLVPGTTYYYYVAALSASGGQGELSVPAEVYYKGNETPVPAAAAPPADNKNAPPMEIVPAHLDYIFSANYKYYQKNPVGVVTVKNNTGTDFSNVKLSFNFKDFMDFPSDTVVPLVKARSSVDVPLLATLNNRILGITENTPIQCQLRLTYYQDGEEKTFTLTQPVTVLSKNAIVWDDASRLGNFITVNDGPITAFRTFALLQKKDLANDSGSLNDNLLTALLDWEALGEYGLTYMSDPVSPFEVLKSSAAVPLDTVQFPRNTLTLKSGDCDDLAALFASVFEASGLHTALLDYPSHIALMFDTGETDADRVGIPAEYLIKRDNTWWVGLETTMVGKSFYDAIMHEADLYRKMKDEVRVIDVRKAMTEFEPVTLPEESSPMKFSMPGLPDRVRKAIDALAALRYAHLKEYYGSILRSAPGDVEANMSLGIAHAQYKHYDEAEACFKKVLEKEPFNAAALNDLGNLSFEAGRYDEAREYYFKASKADPFDGNIWLNLARVAAKQGNKDDVRAFAARAAKIDPGLQTLADKLSK